MYLLALEDAFYNMYIGNFECTTWFMPMTLYFPIDNTKVYGYFLILLFEMYAGYTYEFTMTAVVTYFVSCCFYIEACCQHLQVMFDELDVIAEKDNSRTKYDEMNDRIKKAIKLHIKTMRFVHLKAHIQREII